MIRSKYSLCQIITLFSRQLQNLLYQLARPPAATVYLSVVRLQRKRSAGPSRATEGRAESRELSGCFQQGHAGGGHGGAHPRTGKPAGPPCAPCHSRRSALFRGRRTCTPGGPGARASRAWTGIEPLKSSGQGRASQRKALSQEPRIWPGPDSLRVTHSVGRAPRSGVSWKSVAG